MTHPQLRLNDSAYSFAQKLPSVFPDVNTFFFIIYTPKQNVENRIILKENSSPEKIDLLYGQKKWDFEKQLISSVTKGSNHIEIAKKLLLHNTKEETEYVEVPAKKMNEWLSRVSENLPPKEAIGVASICKTNNGQLKHIPMMDFSCPVSEEGLMFIAASLKAMNENGIILNLGRSYHYYGLQLISIEEWYQFMGNCLLLSPFTDIRYIAHRLISGKCALRINNSSLKKNAPHIVGFVD